MGAFDHLEWTYDGAFEQLFGLGRAKFSKNFPKIQMPGGCPGGMFKLRFDWYISGKFKIKQPNPCGTFEETNLHFTSELGELVARKVEKIILH